MYPRFSTALLLSALACLAADAQNPEQVQVSVKVIEFQTSKDVETGLSAYFQQRTTPRPYGRVSSGNGTISTADITFPATSSNAGITVFLDRLVTKYGDIEVVLQGLVDQGRAFILSQPTVLVPVGEAAGGIPTKITTAQEVPYEDTLVVGSTTVQTTSFKDTGVSLEVVAHKIVDDDGNPESRDDTFIHLQISAEVTEEGQRITVALDDQIAGSDGLFSEASNAILVPEFVSRKITTQVWVRHSQVLMLGGLYRNTEDKDLATLPWLTQGDRFLNGLVQRVVPFAVDPVPISSSIGNNAFSNTRRELVFLIKADVPSLIYDEGFQTEEATSFISRPKDVVTDVLKEISEIPRGIAEGVTGEDLGDNISSGLGATE